jgi:hypothetical protein
MSKRSLSNPQKTKSMPQHNVASGQPVLAGLVPMSSREILWRAKYLGDATSLAHLPFLFWLISDLRPNRAVTLNMNSAVTYFALCQTIDKIGIDTACLGFGAWDGAGVPEDMMRYNTAQYGEFSTLKHCTIAKSKYRIRKSSIDFLMVDGPLDQDIVSAVIHDWAPKMTPRGLIVFSDIDSLDDDTDSLIDVWCADKSTVRLSFGGGLLVVGDARVESGHFSQLSQIDPSSADFMAIERTFARLGASHTHEWAAQASAQALNALQVRYGADDVDAGDTGSGGVQGDGRATAQHMRLSEEIQTLHAELKVARAREVALKSNAKAHDVSMAQLQDHLRTTLATNRTLQTDLSDATVAHASEVSILSDLIEQEGGQRIALSQDLERLKTETDLADVHHIGDIESLTRALALTEEKVILADEELKAAARAHSALEATMANIKDTQADERASHAARISEIKNTHAEERRLHEARITEIQADLVKARLARDAEEARRLLAARESGSLIEDLKASKTSLEQNLKTAQTKLRSHDKTIMTLHRQIADLQDHNRDLQKVVDDMKNSTSWRATATLRQAKAAISNRK